MQIKISRSNKRYKRGHNENLKKDDGWIYIISNPAWKVWYKIGKSTDKERRLENYQIGSPFRDYKIEYSRYVPSMKEVEKKFSQSFVHRNEWYNVELQVLITFLCSMPEAKLRLGV